MPTVKLKTLRIKIYPTTKQKQFLDKFIDTSRFVYNRTLEYIKKGHRINHQDLRDLLVTENTKKGLDEYKAFDSVIEELRKQKKASKDKEEIEALEERIKNIQQERRDKMKDYDSVKNPLIHGFETETPKDIRDNAVRRCCDAFKTAFSNLKAGNIKFFDIQYQKKNKKKQTIELTPKILSITGGKLQIAPQFFNDECFLKTNKPLDKGLEIRNNTDIVRNGKEYYVHLMVPTEPKAPKPLEKVAGVDPGIRTFATVHSGSDSIIEYKHRSDLLKKLNRQILFLKHTNHKPFKKKKKKRIRKKQFSKLEKKKSDYVDRLHWDFTNHVLDKNDLVFFGDIKSHDIVKGGQNRILNLAFNDLKFYQLKQRLVYKAYVYGKKVFMVPEHYTTKTCSCCGKLNNTVGSKEVFSCGSCGLVTGRDMNASKNIKMKGMFL